MIYQNGEQYEGNWADGEKHGRGVYRSGTDELVGEWAKGQLKKKLQ